MKLWAGRFQKPTDELVNDFNASISFDQRLYKQDIAGSKAHAQMLSDCGILTKEDNEKIQRAVRKRVFFFQPLNTDGGQLFFILNLHGVHTLFYHFPARGPAGLTA